MPVSQMPSLNGANASDFYKALSADKGSSCASCDPDEVDNLIKSVKKSHKRAEVRSGKSHHPALEHLDETLKDIEDGRSHKKHSKDSCVDKKLSDIASRLDKVLAKKSTGSKVTSTSDLKSDIARKALSKLREAEKTLEDGLDGKVFKESADKSHMDSYSGHSDQVSVSVPNKSKRAIVSVNRGKAKQKAEDAMKSYLKKKVNMDDDDKQTSMKELLKQAKRQDSKASDKLGRPHKAAQLMRTVKSSRKSKDTISISRLIKCLKNAQQGGKSSVRSKKTHTKGGSK